jgi:hypothetical protein
LEGFIHSLIPLPSTDFKQVPSTEDAQKQTEFLLSQRVPTVAGDRHTKITATLSAGKRACWNKLGSGVAEWSLLCVGGKNFLEEGKWKYDYQFTLTLQHSHLNQNTRTPQKGYI